VNPDLREYVLARDGGCVARLADSPLEAQRWPMLQGLPRPGLCRTTWGEVIRSDPLVGLQLDHVEDADKLSFATKPPDDADHLWTQCPYHHARWATKAEVRNAARAYIPAANEAAAKRGWPRRPEGF
jgi:hypothetical protein